MSFFNRSPERSGSAAAPRERNGRVGGGGDNEISIIGHGMHVTGDLNTEGTVRIEGHVEGTIRAGRSVVLGKSGEVVGDILTEKAVIGGRVVGSVVAEGRLELQSTAVIEGEVRAPAQHLQLDEGAQFNGQIRMTGEQPMRALPAGARQQADAARAEGDPAAPAQGLVEEVAGA